MNRWIKGAVGTAAAVTLSLTGLASVSATEQHGPPKSEYPNTTVEERDFETTIPAGAACKDEIVLKVKETITITELSKNKSIVKFDPSKVVLYNPKTQKKVVVEGGATAVANYAGDDTKVTSTGKTVLLGEGVKGIVLVKGTVKFTVKDDGTEDQKIVIHQVKGKYVELCKKLGTSPATGGYEPKPGHGEPKWCSKHEEYAKAA